VSDVLSRVHTELTDQGWAVLTTDGVSMPREEHVVEAFNSHLMHQGTEIGTRGKMFARDVVRYEIGADGQCWVFEADSLFGSADDPRVFIVREGLGLAVTAFLDLIPPELRHSSGKIALTYFRYDDQVEVGPHQDQFGDVVAIWTLFRTPGGGASFLRTGEQEEVLREELPAGSVLIFRDEQFWHGFTALAPGGSRHALVIIRLRDGV
jgi:hypothetical protein